MSDDPTIRPYRSGDEHGILALFNRVFAIGNPDFVPRPTSHWKWEFEQNPEGQRTMVAVVSGAAPQNEPHAAHESIVGTFTALPARFRFPDGVFTLGQAVDTVIAPEHRQSLRKSGLYLRLATAWYETFGRKSDVRFLYGFPNPQAFRIGTRLSGYEPVRCPVLESSLPVAAAAAWRDDAIPSEAIEVEEVERFGGELGALDAVIARHAALRDRRFVASIRDARAWNWRYAENPTTRYRLLRAQTASGRLRGFLVHGFSWHGFRKDVAPVVDWVVSPSDLATWRALLCDAARAAQLFGGATGPRLVDLVAWATPSHPHSADLAALGFTSAPTIFNLCIRRFPESEYTAEEAREGLCLTMGDSDIF